MFTSHIPLFFILFYSTFILIIAEPMASCYIQGEGIGHDWSGKKMLQIKIPDCQAAKNLIPDGSISLGGDISKPLKLHLPPNACELKYRVPAIFRSGSCMITVEAFWSTNRPPPEKGASALYFTLWPEVKKAAAEVIKHCLVWKYAYNAGNVNTAVELGGQKLSYWIYVMPTPANLPGNGELLHIHPGHGRQRRRPYRVWEA